MTDATARHGLLDTSTFILLVRFEDPVDLPEDAYITAVTLAELTVGPLVATDDDERARRQGHLQEAETQFEALPFDAEAARAFGRVSASLRASGRKARARTFDAMIAATAIANGLPLYTCNPKDFTGIDELELVTVPHPDDLPDGGSS